MDKHETAHWDVAAYALGVLDPREATRYELHLAECANCAAELEFLLPASRLLADVDPEELREAEDPHLADRLVEAVRIDRQQARGRRRRLVAAGLTLAAGVAAFAMFAGATWLAPAGTGEVATGPTTSTNSADAGIPPGVGGPGGTDGDEISATDPDTGVHADVLLESTNWGTQVSLALASVTGPRECQLLLAIADGTTRVAATWRVPEDGYGTAAEPSPLLVQTATAVDRSDIEELQILALEQDGSTTELVTIPA